MSDPKLRNFHEAKWDEPVIFEQSVPGSRSILFPDVSQKAMPVTGDVSDLIPDHLKRQKSPALPEMAQPQVLRHYLRLSQETIGQDINIDIGLGTCTMKYSPKINEQFVRSSKFTEMHPYQDDDTAQGILKIIYDFEQIMKEISGLDAVSFQAGGGGQGIYANAAVLKKYFEDKGEADQRTQIITTILSHPLDSAAPATKGFEVISLYPDENGYPSLENLKAVVSEKTAGIFITNPEDTGVFNPIIREFVDVVHEAGYVSVIWLIITGFSGLYAPKSWEPICVTLISIKRLRPPMHAWDPAVQPSVSARNWRNISPDPGYGSMEPDITQIMTMKARWERSVSSREAWQLYCGHTPGL